MHASRAIVTACGTAVALAWGGVRAASAQVEFYVNASRIDALTGIATFDELGDGRPLDDYREAGLRIAVSDINSGDPRLCGLEDRHFYYAGDADGPAKERVEISREDGGDFEVLEMRVSDGWAEVKGRCIDNLWITVYLGGEVVGTSTSKLAAGRSSAWRGGSICFESERRLRFTDATCTRRRRGTPSPWTTWPTARTPARRQACASKSSRAACVRAKPR